MPIPLVIAGTTYNYPITGEDPGWGEDGTAWAQAVTDVLGTIVGPGDIINKTSLISNNISSPIDLQDMIFSPLIVRAANIDYVIHRTATSPAVDIVESGTLMLTFDAATASWSLAQTFQGSSGVSFSMSGFVSGQVQYTSTDIGSGSYVGTINFRAKTLSI